MKTTRHEMRMRGYTVRWGKYDIASTAILEGGRCDGLPDGWETAKSRRMAEEVRILDDDGKVLHVERRPEVAAKRIMHGVFALAIKLRLSWPYLPASKAPAAQEEERVAMERETAAGLDLLRILCTGGRIGYYAEEQPTLTVEVDWVVEEPELPMEGK